ncbi:hypothetical protein H0H92_010575 [Tricholoma furcatifolium]|nr:hypothetical protein H0H92_010575 [Tricholoma furcatifolium]
MVLVLMEVGIAQSACPIYSLTFNAESFEKLHDLAHDFNLRTLVLNRRGYPGSSQYTDAEMDDLHHGRKVFLDRLAIQLGDFIRQFIENNPDVPKVSLDRKSGGFAIMGWSIGGATAMPLFSDPSLFNEELYGLLEIYVRVLILNDLPYIALGISLPPNTSAYNPWADPEYRTSQEFYQNFCYWASSYFDHPNFSAGSIEALDMRRRTEHMTIMDWTPEQFKRFYSEPAAMRTEPSMYVAPRLKILKVPPDRISQRFAPAMQLTLNNMSHRVLYDETLAQSFFPEVSVLFISATRTTWTCAWGYSEVKRRYDEEVAQGKRVRPTHFSLIDGGNHFSHWDFPKELLDLIVARAGKD